MMKDQKKVMALLLAAFAAAFFVSLYFGALAFSPREVLRLLFGGGADGVSKEIFWKLRLPRVLLGLFVGGGLAVCGAVFQSMLRNPLAEPFTLGISGGAALGVALALVAGIAGKGLSLFSLAGALASMLAVYGIAAKRRFSNSALILGGVVLNFLFSSFVLLLVGLARSSQIRSAMMWLMGDVSSAPVSSLPFIAVTVSLASALLFLFSRELDVLTLGMEKAFFLGLDAERFKKIIFVLGSCVVGACVSVSGITGFVGLMMPHFARWLTGASHRRVLPASFLSGAVFFMLCDTFARNIARPVEIPVGVVTGVAGGVFFVVLILRSRRWEDFS